MRSGSLRSPFKWSLKTSTLTRTKGGIIVLTLKDDLYQGTGGF